MWTLALLWGASYLFIKIGLEDFQPFFLVFSRLVLASAVLVPLAARRNALAPLRSKLHVLPILALMQVVVPFVLITYGERHIDSSLAGILVAAAPIFTA